ncbi:hypothetical protein FUT69_00905 [Xylella taiwanensis]|nr:hypothetical protein [Xylella taiwanensis]AXI83095.1 hypothetical protein AB672_03590 [Xylella taiwanensis]MCD8456136.1 hypothetical protein [Xylella taiwanensis]MCD8458542.1 hypothetical protein [Xylella taiwanensis]MCD8460677.1 hypothetical protein [Xylella taiwanensis]MCD8463261.1 hypothetical protein [Xylella taiwanensis]
MNKFKAMMIAFDDCIASNLLAEGVSRLRMKMVFFTGFIFVFLYIVFTDIDIASFDVGMCVILVIALSIGLLCINRYFKSHFHADGSLKKKKNSSEDAV